MGRDEWVLTTILVSALGLCAPASSFAGSVFVSGHDPDYHAISGNVNTVGAQHIIQRALEFARDGKVTDVHRYTLADGRVVDFSSRETPTRGRDYTLLQQIFNSVPGRIGQPGPNQQNPGGGGPVPGPGR